jgi:hypothetical protein
MPPVPFLRLAALTRDINDSGSSDRLNLTVNVAGIDVAVVDFVADHPESQGYLRRAEAVVELESTALTDSSVRIGTRGDDSWAPQHIFLFGQTSRGSVIPLAMETDISTWLSSDASEGALTIPLRLVELGGADIPIQRLLLLVSTADRRDAGTEDTVQLEIRGPNGPNFFSAVIKNTPQDDLDRNRSNWYEFPVSPPFTTHDFNVAHGRITLTMLGEDAWLPGSLFLFGLDTATGRPTRLVPLASVPTWDKGWLSADESEGTESVLLRS